MTEIFMSCESNGHAIWFGSEEYAIEFGRPYFKMNFEDIPTGEGQLLSDGISRVWREVQDNRSDFAKVIHEAILQI